MAKPKKKRNKPYRGSDAKNRPASIIRVDAVKRNKAHQWWVDNKRIAKPGLIIALIILIISICIAELVRLMAT